MWLRTSVVCVGLERVNKCLANQLMIVCIQQKICGIYLSNIVNIGKVDDEILEFVYYI